ncbi:hypothetical protein DYBT9275_02855 [Dyadobacter sp. CECT 9275]|uniref:Uncharacterized protein n=1 Tax=Dyadobacter helix TaxID=2822344 RepID=A0A916N685_9BACT|nr:hypothetical protein DYBT9275_02855 [Dyadobacter sp. CECT 9275]
MENFRVIIYYIINVFVFILLRYATILLIFIAWGIGNNYTYSFLQYLPALFLQVFLIIYSRKRIKWLEVKNQNIVIFILLCLFFF